VVFTAINSKPDINSIAVAPNYDFTKVKAKQGQALPTLARVQRTLSNVSIPSAAALGGRATNWQISEREQHFHRERYRYAY
jgi:hypothetical protein